MSGSELAALEALLAKLRTAHDDMKKLRAGVAVLHAEAAITTLESHLRKHRASRELETK